MIHALSKKLEFSVGVCYNERQRKKNFLICHKAFVCVMRSAKEEVANELSYYDEPPVGRFPKIEEDEPPYRLLCNEYPAAKD